MWKQQLAISREKETERDREGNARWGRMEHIDRKLDFGHIRFTARDTLHLCQTRVWGKYEHISYILITLSLLNNIQIRYSNC